MLGFWTKAHQLFRFWGFPTLLAIRVYYTPKIISISIQNSYFFLDYLSCRLITLTLLIVFLIKSASEKLYQGTGNQNYENLILTLRVILIYRFSVNSVLGFYIFFELSLFPILFIILGWGYQPERLLAGFSLLTYTILASLPLLFIILRVNSLFSGNFYFFRVMPLAESVNDYDFWFNLIAITGFLVKFPMYSVHLWLPKAHVEAPVAGSIILAALLLKLGGYGLIRISPVLLNRSLFILILQIFCVAGSVVISFLCLSQKDIKVLIAYSSVAHMGIVISAAAAGGVSATTAAVVIIVAHGISSSAIFFVANVFYLRVHTRNILLMKRILARLPMITIIWFCICLANIGGPPTVNLSGEILCIISLVNLSSLFRVPLFILTFLAAAFTLILYSATQHGQEPLSASLNQRRNLEETFNILTHIVLIVATNALIVKIFYIYISN